MFLNYLSCREQSGFSCKKDKECFESRKIVNESIKTVKKSLKIPTISFHVKEKTIQLKERTKQKIVVVVVAGTIAKAINDMSNRTLVSNQSSVDAHREVCNAYNHKPQIERILFAGGDDIANEKELQLLNGKRELNKKLKIANPERQINQALRKTSPWYKKMLRNIDLTTLATIISKAQVPFDTSVKLTVDTVNPINQFTGLLTEYQNFKKGCFEQKMNQPRINIESPVQHKSSKSSVSKLPVINDFESRNEDQKILNNPESVKNNNKLISGENSSPSSVSVKP